MLATTEQYKSNIIQLQPLPPEPLVGSTITFMHRDRLMTGKVWGTIHTQIKRYRVDGVHPVVCEYICEPLEGQTPWKYVTVHESDVVWGAIQ